MARNHIICVGAVYIDTILTVPHFPVEDDKLRASRISKRRGGNTANTLEVLAQLVSRPSSSSNSTPPPSSANPSSFLHLLSVLPAETSPATTYIASSLPNVDITNSSIFRSDHQDAASSYILHNSDTHSRTIVSINQLPELTFEEFSAKVQAHGAEWKKAWFHFEGRIPEVVCQCIRWLRSWSDDVKISLECEKPDRIGLEEVLSYPDVVFFSKIWAHKKGIHNCGDLLDYVMTNSEYRDVLLCCTWGARGAGAVLSGCRSPDFAETQAWHPGRDEQEEAEVVDTIGAGDTFIAGMLFALNHREKEWTLQQKLKFANELAGRKVIQEGFAGLGEQMLW